MTLDVEDRVVSSTNKLRSFIGHRMTENQSRVSSEMFSYWMWFDHLATAAQRPRVGPRPRQGRPVQVRVTVGKEDVGAVGQRPESVVPRRTAGVVAVAGSRRRRRRHQVPARSVPGTGPARTLPRPGPRHGPSRAPPGRRDGRRGARLRVGVAAPPAPQVDRVRVEGAGWLRRPRGQQLRVGAVLRRAGRQEPFPRRASIRVGRRTTESSLARHSFSPPTSLHPLPRPSDFARVCPSTIFFQSTFLSLSLSLSHSLCDVRFPVSLWILSSDSLAQRRDDERQSL